MKFIRRHWTAAAADNWSKEDWIAILFSALAYILLTVGSALTLLLIPVGFVILGLGIIFSLLMYWVIDPKLRSISTEYEKHQEAYLQNLEAIQKWEDRDE
jgi:hypothetical protein